MNEEFQQLMMTHEYLSVLELLNQAEELELRLKMDMVSIRANRLLRNPTPFLRIKN